MERFKGQHCSSQLINSGSEVVPFVHEVVEIRILWVVQVRIHKISIVFGPHAHYTQGLINKTSLTHLYFLHEQTIVIDQTNEGSRCFSTICFRVGAVVVIQVEGEVASISHNWILSVIEYYIVSFIHVGSQRCEFGTGTA